MRRRCCLAIVVLVGLAGPAYSQARLEWRFKEGDRFFEEIVTTGKHIERTAGQETKSDVNHTLVVSFAVLKKNADGVEMEHKIEGFKTNVPGAPERGSDHIHRMEGLPFRIAFDPKMKITKFEGYEEVVKRLSDNKPDIAQMIRLQMPEEDLRRAAEALFPRLPDNPVRKGDKWKHEFVFPLGQFGNLKALHSYEYLGQDTLDGKTVEKIGYTATATHVPPMPKEGGLAFKILKCTVKVDDLKGTHWFDAAGGRLVQSETTMRVKGSMTVSVMEQKFEQELESDQTIKTRVLDRNPLKK